MPAHWTRKVRQFSFFIITLSIIAVVLFLLIPSFLLTQSRLSTRSITEFSCNPQEGTVPQRLWCSTARGYLGMFVDDLESYDVRRVNEALAGAATEANAYVKDLDAQMQEYVQSGSKKQVRYVYDSGEDAFLPVVSR